MLPFQIYPAVWQLKDCTDRRPWIIIDIRPNEIFGCFPISTQAYDGGFFIPNDHADFVSTGLTRSCYVQTNGPIMELPLTVFGKLKGRFEKQLLNEFQFHLQWNDRI